MKRLITALAIALVFTLCVVSAQADEGTTGKIRSVNGDRKEIVLKGLTGDTTYEVEKDAVLWLDGRRCKLTDLKADDRVVVRYNKQDKRHIAGYVRALRDMDEASGAVREVSGEKKQVVIKGTVKDATYELTKDATIWVDGKKGSVTDLRAGDEIRVTYVRRDNGFTANDVVLLKRK